MADDLATRLAQKRARGLTTNGLPGDRTSSQFPIESDAPKAGPERPRLFPPGIPLGDENRMVGRGPPDLSQRAATSDVGDQRALPVVELMSVELKPAENVVILAFSDGEKIQVAWPEAPPEKKLTPKDLPPGDYNCAVGPDGSIVIGKMTLALHGKPTSWPLNKQAAFSAPRSVTCHVSWPDSTSAPDAGQPSGAPIGDRGLTPPLRGPISYPRTGDVAALANNAQLRAFIWEMLVHFDVTRRTPPKAVTLQDLMGESASNPTAAEVVAIAVQSWEEFDRTTTKDLNEYQRLTETLIEQWLFGNDTVRLNRLALRDQPQGWGLYLRESGIRYYDQLGIPDTWSDGTTRDWHYKFAKQFDVKNPIGLILPPDDPLYAVAGAFRAGGIPTPDMLKAATEGYLKNVDLLVDELRNNPASLKKALDQLHDQTLLLAEFLGIEALAAFLQALPFIPAKEVGAGLQLVLKGTAYYFNVSLGTEGLKVALQIGSDLYRVKKGKDGKPDGPSQRHLKDAAKSTRALLESAAAVVAQIAAGLAAKGIASAVAKGGGPAGPAFSILVTPDGRKMFAFGTGDQRITPPIVVMAASEGGLGGNEKPKPEEKGKAPSASAGKSPAPADKSWIRDTDFGLTPQQRNDIRSGKWRGETVTVKTEEIVGKKLVKATGLPLQGPDSPTAKQLREPPPEGKPAPPITKPALLEAPVVKTLEPKSVGGRLLDWIPDFLLMRPGRFEVFEVTVDTYMNLTRQLKGMVGGDRWSFSHKIEQLAKSEFLIRRYPNADIVYNIQTFGELNQRFFEEKLKDVTADLTRARRDAKATGSFQIVIRGDSTVVIDVP
jgi:hypothetical protein